MLIVTGTVKVAAKDIDKIKPIAVKMATASRAEDGCHGYVFYQSIEDAQTFRVYEQWTDAAALAYHFSTPHMAEFRKSLAKIKILEMDVVKFEAGVTNPVG